MKDDELYDVFDPDCYNNVFVYRFLSEPMLTVGCSAIFLLLVHLRLTRPAQRAMSR
jgi:hypothetical protein